MADDARNRVDDAAGHRARLRDRLLENGGESFHDYELIEYYLFHVIPRRDTKAIAKALLREFGTIGGVLTADATALARVDGMGATSAAALKIAHAVTIRMLKSEVAQRPVLSNWQALLDYLRADMAHRGIECVRVLHLDSRNRLILDDKMSEGTVDQAVLHPREVIKRALEVNAASIILVHNHPSGDPQPSRADIDLTRTIVAAGKPLGIAVHDHLIIGTEGHSSLRALGLM
jgi:DNA repair protein RadC